MSAQGRLTFYSHHGVDDATIIANFVARHAELDSLLASLRANAKGSAARHEIIVGARGMGKTMLLRRIAIAIGEDEELSRIFVPLRFREEQYNVISLGAFWRNCCDALAEWCEKAKQLDLSKRLDAEIDTGDAETLETAFLDVCKTLGRRAVLLLDNLDLILDNLKDDNWRLRGVLQSVRGPIVIGAATQLLAQSGDRNAPFYEFFHPHILEPLGEKELLACLRALAGVREKGAAVLALLAREPERALALYALTGGNPRILALIYQLLERADSHEIFTDLEALLDQVTPFYKARVEEYEGTNQRAVIDAVALNWDPISSAEIAATTGIAVTSISSILDRLKRDGFIEEVQGSGARAKYQLAERFLNIWYLMRHGTRQTRQRLRWLTILLARLFSESELERMARDGERMAGVWRADWCEAVRDALAEVIRAKEKLQERFRIERAMPHGTRASATPEKTHAETEAREIQIRADQFYERREFQQAIDTLDRLVACFATSEAPTMQERVARALFNKGVALRQLGRYEEAIAIYDESIARFGASEAPTLQEHVARALNNKGVALGQLGRADDALIVFDDLISRFGVSGTPALEEQVARALINKGIALGQLGCAEESIAVYDKSLARFGASAAPPLQEQCARALLNKGVSLWEVGRTEEAVVVYDDLIVRFEASEAPELQQHVARALHNKAFLLGQLGNVDEELVVYDDLIARFGTSDAPALQELLAQTFNGRGQLLADHLGRREEAEAAYRRGLFFAPKDEMLRANLAWLLLETGRVKEAEPLIAQLSTLAPEGRALLDAGHEIAADNFGSGVAHLGKALDMQLEDGRPPFFEDLLRLLRLAAARGSGERLLEWFKESGNADRYAPVYGALVAKVRGEQYLRDLNPEVRRFAEKFYDFLSRPKKEEPPAKKARRSTRRRG